MIEQPAVPTAVDAAEGPNDRSMKMLEYAVSLIAALAAVALAFAGH